MVREIGREGEQKGGVVLDSLLYAAIIKKKSTMHLHGQVPVQILYPGENTNVKGTARGDLGS